MADGIFVPPHLQIDPLRPVQFFLQGTNTGVGAAEARNRAQAAAMELAQRAAAQQAANERAALAAQADAAQTAARIQDLQQQRELNEQRAAVMAKRYAASNSIRDAIARGVPPAQAAYMFPDFYLESPSAFTSMMRENELFKPEIIDVNGTKVMRTSRGQVQVLPQGASTGPIQTVPIVNSAGQQVGEGIRGPTGGVQQVATERAGALSQEEFKKLDYWADKGAAVAKKMDRMEADAFGDFDTLNKDKAYKRLEKELEEANRERRKILGLSEESPAVPQFLPGQKVRQNGIVYQFDGTNWIQLR